MSRTALLIRCFLVPAILIAVALSSPAQLVMGQYEDEAPLRTWNTFGLATAASTGRGETNLIQTDDSSAALANPALLAGLPGFTVSLSGSYSRSSLFRYSIVNTGVLVSKKNLGVGLFALDFAGVSYRFREWTFALTAALTEAYDRPQAYAESISQGVPDYAILFEQSGFLRTVNLAVARGVGSRFQVGIGVNFVRGELERRVVDESFNDDITISHQVNQTFSGVFFNFGLLAHIRDHLDLAFALRTPYEKKARSRSELRYLAPQGGTDILIDAESDDLYRQPWAAGVGARYEVSPRFRLFGSLTYFRWSGYKVEYFGEEETRDFGSTFKTAVGGEWSFGARIFNNDIILPLRLGLGYDRQPMRTPRSAYVIFSAGTGVHWRAITFDIGSQIGRESGSGRNLDAKRVCVSLGFKK